MAIDLHAGEWTARIAPALGGAILSLRRGGEDVLRPAADEVQDILATACWPLVPYANRIAFGRFRFDGRNIAVPRNFGDHPHSLHGIGWHTSWQIEQRTDAAVTLLHRHAGGTDWPWCYQATQHLSLDTAGLSASLELRNDDSQAMPASLGWHPYFPASPDTRLRFDADEMWLCDADQLPTRAVAGAVVDQWRHGAAAQQAELIDHCHAGWSGDAALYTGSRSTRLHAREVGFLHIHSPPGCGYVGIEPVTAMPDAFNRAEPARRTGLRVLAPGESMSLTMRIESD